MELLGLYLVADPLWWTGRSLSDVIRLILEHGYEKVHGTVMQYVSRYALVYRYIYRCLLILFFSFCCNCKCYYVIANSEIINHSYIGFLWIPLPVFLI